MLRQILAVAAGFVTMSVLLLAAEYGLVRFFFHSLFDMGPLPPAYLLAYGICSLFFAVIGGCITAAISGRYEAPTILGALLLGMGIGTLLMNRGNQPIWYAATVPLLSALAATIAGYRWLGQLPEAQARKSGRR
jgi:hypothetical protein